ncbi:MAG: hypothetical protein KA004_12905 [Verrucomicrobiales bacterium]|nr:hypothetical protein [Verrucomicrobiales bacterium]
MPTIIDNLVEYKGSKSNFAGWFNEAVWGHRLQAQRGWATTLEFLGMVEGLIEGASLLTETQPDVEVAYTAPVSKELRILIFNNPRMVQIRNDHQDNEDAMWENWLKDIAARVGDEPINFGYLRNSISSFSDLVERVELVRKLVLDTGKTNKYTYRLLFPIGPAALYEPNELNFIRDRNTFTRTGEITYLMVSRASRQHRDELRRLLEEFLDTNTSRNRLVLSLMPPGKKDRGSKKGATYLPYQEHPAFNRLAEDLIAILRLGLPHQDALEHIRFIIPLHLYIYGVETSAAWSKSTSEMPFLICEIPGPRMDVVRRASIGNKDENEAMGQDAMRSYVNRRIGADKEVALILSEDFQPDLSEKDRAGELANEMSRLFALNDDHMETLRKFDTRDEVLSGIRREAEKAYRLGTMPALESLGREAGLIDSRGTVKKRYAPTDSLLRALVFANIVDDVPVEEADFLELLLKKYGIVFGAREAAITIGKHNPQHYDEADYKLNQGRLSRRLVGLGLGNTMSDACTYVLNPLGRPRQSSSQQAGHPGQA